MPSRWKITFADGQGAEGSVNTSVTMHSTYRLATHELQDDKLSVRKATLPCKKQGFLTLGALRPGLTPPVYPACCYRIVFRMIPEMNMHRPVPV